MPLYKTGRAKSQSCHKKSRAEKGGSTPPRPFPPFPPSSSNPLSSGKARVVSRLQFFVTMMSPMTTKIYACVVHDKRTLSLLKVFFHRFSGGREKKRVVNVFHTNKVFRLDARPENDKTKRFLVCEEEGRKKKRERFTFSQ